MKKSHLALLTILTIVVSTLSINAQKITLTSKGEVEVTPNIAITNINIIKTNEDAKALKKEVLTISNDLNNQLKKLKIDSKDIQTSNLQINKEYNWVKGKKVFIGYRASINSKVTFKNIDNLAKIYTELLSNENITIGGLRYDYSKKEEAEEQAYINALKKANTLAKSLYAETKSINENNSKNFTIIAISNNGTALSPSPRPMFKAMDSNIETAPETNVDINVGTLTYSKTITVVYDMK